MYQIDNSTAAATIPASTPVGTPGYFTDGNPATGVAATIMPAEFMNALMMENLNVLSAAGIAPAKGQYNQLALAISKIVSSGASWNKIADKPTTVAGFGITDVYTKNDAISSFIKQGGGIGQTPLGSNAIYIGWSPQGRLRATVDTQDLGEIAFTSNLQSIVNQIVGTPPSSLNTIEKVAFAVGSDPAYAQTVNSKLDGKADKATTLAGYGIALPTQPEAEAGTENTKPSTSLRVAQYVTKVLQGFQAALGFSPVQQGGGIGQTGTTQNKVFIGFGTNNRLKATVDNTDLGNIVFDTNAAQEATPGILKLATLSAVQLGAETLSAVTPKNLRAGFFISLSANGYIVFPTWMGSFMFQWGRYSLAAPVASSVVVNFPIPFGTVLHAWTGVDGASNDQIGTLGITATGMTVSKGSADAAPRTGSWFAIGGAV